MKISNAITTLWNDKEKRYLVITVILLFINKIIGYINWIIAKFRFMFIYSFNDLIKDGNFQMLICCLTIWLIVTFALLRNNNSLIFFSFFASILSVILEEIIYFNLLKIYKFNRFRLILPSIFNSIPLVAVIFLFYFIINNNALYKKIWIIPSILFLIVDIITYKIYTHEFYNKIRWKTNFRHFIYGGQFIYIILNFLTFFFLGLYCKYSTNQPSRPAHQKTKLPQTQLGNADKLIKYKELLDLNIITQDEFNEKKNELI